MAAGSPSTYELQPTLPKLPVPTLEDTMRRYLESVRPLVSEDEYRQAEKDVEDFVAGPATTLHDLLLKRAEETETSWLIDWWNEHAYLRPRLPTPINVNYHFTLPHPPLKTTQARRAAQITEAVVNYKLLLESENVPVEFAGKGPQCMEMYRKMFGSCRIPLPEMDDYRVVSPEESRHMVVFHKHRIYAVDVIDSSGAPVSVNTIERALLHILSQGLNKETPQNSVAILTSCDRDEWAAARESLASHPVNAAHLFTIESAAFGLCLESESPVDDDDFNRRLFTAPHHDRWYDKSFHYVVFPDGHTGYHGEHAGMDGTTLLPFVGEVVANAATACLNAQPNPDVSKPLLMLQTPRELVFNLTAEQNSVISRAASKYEAACKLNTMVVLNFSHFGKSLIKSLKVHPDAFVQAALHLAYYRLWGKVAPCYESAATRKFAYGRTETVRSGTNAMKNFLETVDNDSVELQDKAEALRTACARHAELLREAVNAEGVDRHLMGLQLLAGENGIEAPFFSTHHYSYSKRWILSTSQMPSPYLEAGFGAAVDDGYGVCYNIPYERIHLKIATRQLRPEPFRDMVEASLLDMSALLSVTSNL